jgi:hypothetical protein
MAGFWGEPVFSPEDGEVAKFVTQIRELTKRHPPDRQLQVATAAMHAIAAFVGDLAGPREVMAITDAVRAKIGGVP